MEGEIILAETIKSINIAMEEIKKVIISSDESNEEKDIRLAALEVVKSVANRAIGICESFEQGGVFSGESHQSEVVLNKKKCWQQDLIDYYKETYTDEEAAFIVKNQYNKVALEGDGKLNDALRKYITELDQSQFKPDYKKNRKQRVELGWKP